MYAVIAQHREGTFVGEKKQFVYFLRLIPLLLDLNNWTNKEEDIVERHFVRLQGLLADGRLIRHP